MIIRLSFALVILAAVGCAGRQPGAEPAPGATPFAYAVQQPTSVAYETADTTLVALEGGDWNVQIDAASKIGVALDLSPGSNGVRGTIRVTSLDGHSTNSMGPSFTLTPSDLPGPAEVTVTATGVVDIVQQPELSENLQRVISINDLYRRYFIRMPARPVAFGESWTDTVSLADQTLGLTSNVLSVITSAYARDTTVAGRTLNVITSTLSNTVRVTGTSEGVQLEQNLSGEGQATTLWDPSRRLIVERRESGMATGTTDLPGMGVSGLPTNVRASQTLRLTPR